VIETEPEDEDNIFTVSHPFLGEDGTITEKICMMVQTKVSIEIRFELKEACG